MSTKLYVGNLPFDVTEDDLRNMLSAHGPVNEIAVVMDRITGRARGFAFATMNTPQGASAGRRFPRKPCPVLTDLALEKLTHLPPHNGGNERTALLRLGIHFFHPEAL
jgi:hypothetical protein